MIVLLTGGSGCGKSVLAEKIIATLPMEKRVYTATYTLSKVRLDLLIISICPLVIGSKLPGTIAYVILRHSP